MCFLKKWWFEIRSCLLLLSKRIVLIFAKRIGLGFLVRVHTFAANM